MRYDVYLAAECLGLMKQALEGRRYHGADKVHKWARSSPRMMRRVESSLPGRVPLEIGSHADPSQYP